MLRPTAKHPEQAIKEMRENQGLTRGTSITLFGYSFNINILQYLTSTPKYMSSYVLNTCTGKIWKKQQCSGSGWKQ